jgi:hypothetical protein
VRQLLSAIKILILAQRGDSKVFISWNIQNLQMICLHAIRILGFERNRSESCDLVRFSCEHDDELSRAEQPLVSEEGIYCVELNHVTCLGFISLSQRCWWLVSRDVMTWRMVNNRQFGRTCCLFFSGTSQKLFKKRRLTISSPVVNICTTRFNIKKFYVVPTQCICVFCVDLRKNSDYFPIQC